MSVSTELSTGMKPETSRRRLSSFSGHTVIHGHHHHRSNLKVVGGWLLTICIILSIVMIYFEQIHQANQNVYANLNNCEECNVTLSSTNCTYAAQSRHFIVLAAPRTGSTLLVQLINQHPDLKSYQELLHTDMHLSPRGLDNSPRYKVFHYVRDIIHKWGCYRLTGFKLYTQHLEDTKIDLRTVLELLEWPKVILLYRENMFDAYASLRKAFQTHIWNTEIPEVAKRLQGVRINVTWTEYKEYFQRQRRLWYASLKDLEGYPFLINFTYNDVAHFHNDVMKKIENFLGVPPSPVPYKPLLIKIGTGTLHQRVQNFQEIEEWYLEEFEDDVKINLTDMKEKLQNPEERDKIAAFFFRLARPPPEVEAPVAEIEQVDSDGEKFEE